MLEIGQVFTLSDGEVVTYGGVFIPSKLKACVLHTFYRTVGAPYNITMSSFEKHLKGKVEIN